MEKTTMDVAMATPKKQVMRHLKVYSKQDVLSLTKLRRFETKLGERVQVVSDTGLIEESIAASNASYVLFGIPEDLGAKGNFGIGGADTLWIPFLQSFLNTQSNDFFDGGNILLIGHFDFGVFTTGKRKAASSEYSISDGDIGILELTESDHFQFAILQDHFYIFLKNPFKLSFMEFQLFEYNRFFFV